MISGSKIIHRFLVNRGIKCVSGYSGGAVLPLLNEFTQCNKIKFIKNSNEQCSGHFAQGISKSSSTPGVIVTTSGPGITNCITPLYDSYADGIPLIVISAQVDYKFIGTDAFQEAPAIEVTKPFVKYSKLVSTIEELEYILKYSYDMALRPRCGPVHLDIPKNVLLDTIEDDDKRNIIYDQPYINNSFESVSNIAGKNEYNDLVNRINRSKRPIFCFGKGAINASDNANKLCMDNNIPCVTTLHGMGVVNEKYKYSLGMVGMHGSAAANIAIQEADLIIGVGNRFDDRTIGNIGKYATNTRTSKNGLGIVHIDSSYDQIAKVSKIFINEDIDLLSICSDSNKIINYLVRNICKTKNKYDEWTNKITNLKNQYKFEYLKTKQIKVQDVIKNIDDTIESLNIDRGNIFFTTGVGNHQMFTSQFITWTHPGKMITSGSAGTMGVGVPFALGVKTANPNSYVLCIDGDGSFNMTATELLTVSENNIPVKILIMNDSRQQMVYVWQKLFFDENYIATENKNPSYIQLAKAYGIKAYKCDNHKDLAKINKEMMLYNDGPVIVEYVVEPDMCLPLVSPGKGLDDMILYNETFGNLDKKNVPS